MTRFAKILTSGSPAEVTSITASTIPNITGTTREALVFVDSNGKFRSSSAIFYTASNGGQFVLDNVNLNAYTITASGIPDALTDQSSIIFINEAGGFETTSSLIYVSSNNAIYFDGVFSGSFTGDGSGLTGVIGNVEYPLVNSVGIASSSGDAFEWVGDKRVDLAVLTASNGGLEFEDDGLRLASTLAGEGLTWATQYNELKVDLSGSSNGDSGLKLTSDGLAISDNLASGVGAGIVQSSGVLSIATASAGGIINASGLRLITTLPGYGLVWENEATEMRVDYNEIVTSSATITFTTASNNLTLTVSSSGTTSSVSNGITAYLIDNPKFTYGLSDTLVGDFDITGDFDIAGSLTITGGSIKIGSNNAYFNDQFILLNSGSSTGDGGVIVQTGTNVGAFLFFDTTNQRWGVTKAGISDTDDTHGIYDNEHAAINTVTVTSDTESDILTSTPLFGNSDAARTGQIVVTSNAILNESPLYIYA